MTLRVFSGCLATETNTFAPMPTGMASYRDRGYYKAGAHPDHMSFYAGPLWAARLRGKEAGWTLKEGMVAAAQPSGVTTRATYEALREELLVTCAPPCRWTWCCWGCTAPWWPMATTTAKAIC